MPSPTESTEPISLTVASVPKLAIWSLMTLLISAARISIIQPFIGGIWAYGLSALHRLRETIEPGTDAAVDQLAAQLDDEAPARSEEHTSELQSLMRISYAVFCLTKKNKNSTLSTQTTS